MAMDVGGSKGSLKADINVTPLVDVMLVLLIIMMLIAPMLQKGVNVTLPIAGNTLAKPDNQTQTVVAVDSAEPDVDQRPPGRPRRTSSIGSSRSSKTRPIAPFSSRVTRTPPTPRSCRRWTTCTRRRSRTSA